jgi:putative copper export protein
MAFKLLIVFHLIGAAIWVGGHLVLCLVILPKALRLRDPQLIAQFETHYEKIGIPALLLQVFTGIWLTNFYARSFFDIFQFGDPQHTLIATKFILLVCTVIIAVHARIRLIGKLQEANLVFLAWHIVTVTLLGLTMLFLGAGVRLGGW